MFDNNFYFLSWEKAYFNVIRLQRRILKAVYVGDFFTALKLQRLLIISSSARLLSIRLVTKTSIFKGFVSSVTPLNLTFLEKFKLNNLLIKNVNRWYPVKYKKILILDNPSLPSFDFQFWSIPDLCWIRLISFAIESSHEAFFSPRNFSLYGLSFVHRVQKLIFLNLLKESYGLQKRVLIINLSETIRMVDFALLLKKLLVPRSIKLGIFRFLSLGLQLDLNNILKQYNYFGFLLANILISDIDFFFDSIRVGSSMLIFLKPNDNESYFLSRFLSFFYKVGIIGVRS